MVMEAQRSLSQPASSGDMAAHPSVAQTVPSSHESATGAFGSCETRSGDMPTCRPLSGLDDRRARSAAKVRRPLPTSVNMEVNLGGLAMKNPVTTASGTFAAGREYADFVDVATLGAVTT